MYKFLCADVGRRWAIVILWYFNTSPLRPTLESGDIGFPVPSSIPNDDKDIMYFLVWDSKGGNHDQKEAKGSASIP